MADAPDHTTIVVQVSEHNQSQKQMGEKKQRGGKRAGAGRKKGSIDRARPAEKAEFAQVAKQFAPRALQNLIDIATNPESVDSARVAASKELIDRAYGRAPQAVDVEGDLAITIVSSVPRSDD